MVGAAPFPVNSAPLPGQPFIGCLGSIGPIHSLPFTVDTLGRPIRPIKPHAISSGINQGFFPTAPHGHNVSRHSAPILSNNAAQLEARRLLQRKPTKGSSQQNTKSNSPYQIRGNLKRSPLHSANAHPDAHFYKTRRDPSSPHPGSSSPFDSLVPSAGSRSRTGTTKHGSPSDRGVQASHPGSLVSSQSREYLFVAHGQRDPTARSLNGRSVEDNKRREAIREVGGVCGTCGRSKGRCDALDHCESCARKGIPSEEQFWASLEPPSYIPGLEFATLYNLERPAVRNNNNNRLLGEPISTMMSSVQQQAIDHVNDWFKNVTRMIDSKPFYKEMFHGEVSLKITSGSDRKRTTSFNLTFLDISGHLEQGAYPLDAESFLAGFVGHSSGRMPPALRRGQLPSRCVRHLSWVVSQAFAFLRSFADADMYAAINSMPAARATVSMIYASLYRLILDKGDDLCSFILKSLQQDFRYCVRRSRQYIMEDMLYALAQYYRVVTGLANLELRSSSEIEELLSGLRGRATTLLRMGGIKRLLLQTYEKTKARPAPAAHGGNSQVVFDELISFYSSEVCQIEPLSIALRVNSGNNQLRPVSTEAFRDLDPYHHFKPIKVQDLLKEIGPSVVHPQQMYVDGFVDNFDILGPSQLVQPGPSDTCPSFWVGQEEVSHSGYAVAEAVSTSLDPHHASISPSQQDTETESIKSESTVQNDLDFEYAEFLNVSPKDESAGHEWRNVSRGKGCKRRERSGDSQDSHRSYGYLHRKNVRLDSGRESPPPHYNSFGPLTHEPTALQ